MGNDAGELLLIQRADSGVWLYPTGWADVGYSPAEVVVKEVAEETGIEVEVLGLLAVLDGLRMGLRIPMYSLVWHCRAWSEVSLPAHPLECSDLGCFCGGRAPVAARGGAAVEGRCVRRRARRTGPAHLGSPASARLARPRPDLSAHDRSCAMRAAMIDVAGRRCVSHSSPIASWSTSPDASRRDPELTARPRRTAAPARRSSP